MNVYDFHERNVVRAPPDVEELAHITIGAAIEVHRHIGPGMQEISYRKAMSHELDLQGVPHECEFNVPVMFKGVLVGEGRVDILVAKRLVVEIKVVERLTGVHTAQTVAYLQALKLPLGLLLNFNVAVMKDGIKRVINTFR